ncbi:MAG: chorismate synthase [Ruminococcaceae bacterium]|nr:chorismate synthase [Oscillospiraceae bacterium]
MSSTYRGKNLTLTVFGQSHSSAIGAVLDGVPAGFHPDMDKLQSFMKRRAPGQNKMSTQRREADVPEILSGLAGGATCGAPLAFMIRNTDQRSNDYAEICDAPRPGHADFTAHVKYGGHNDVAGGGHFSGRLTAPICAAGGVLLQYLRDHGVTVAAHIENIGKAADVRFDAANVTGDELDALLRKDFPVIDDSAADRMAEEIEKARLAADSVGGVIECAVCGLPAGLGDPMFDGIENRLAQALFAIPAVKGVEFGAGFAVADMLGSENNDPFFMDGDTVRTKTNNHGGILGGITSGMPLIFRIALKPTPSIGKEQDTVSLSNTENTRLTVKGRHDPCVVVRAVPVVEAVAALVLADLMIG